MVARPKQKTASTLRPPLFTGEGPAGTSTETTLAEDQAPSFTRLAELLRSTTPMEIDGESSSTIRIAQLQAIVQSKQDHVDAIAQERELLVLHVDAAISSQPVEDQAILQHQFHLMLANLTEREELATKELEAAEQALRKRLPPVPAPIKTPGHSAPQTLLDAVMLSKVSTV